MFNMHVKCHIFGHIQHDVSLIITQISLKLLTYAMKFPTELSLVSIGLMPSYGPCSFKPLVMSEYQALRYLPSPTRMARQYFLNQLGGPASQDITFVKRPMQFP